MSAAASAKVVQANLQDPAHRRAILALLEAYARDPMGGARELSAAVRDAVLPGLERHPTTLVFLAFAGEDPIGLAVCFVGFSTFAARPLINVHDLAVREDARGQGVGRRLLEAVEARARELGCCKLTLEVRGDNTRARALYDGFGFGDDPGVSHAFLAKPL